jgi:hypothetical protein
MVWRSGRALQAKPAPATRSRVRTALHMLQRCRAGLRDPYPHDGDRPPSRASKDSPRVDSQPVVHAKGASTATGEWRVRARQVPSRVVLEFGDAISGISRVSGQAARSIG